MAALIIDWWTEILFRSVGAIIWALYVIKLLFLRSSLRRRTTILCFSAILLCLCVFLVLGPQPQGSETSSRPFGWILAPAMILVVPISSLVIDQFRNSTPSKQFKRWILEILVIYPLWTYLCGVLALAFGWVWI